MYESRVPLADVCMSAVCLGHGCHSPMSRITYETSIRRGQYGGVRLRLLVENDLSCRPVRLGSADSVPIAKIAVRQLGAWHQPGRGRIFPKADELLSYHRRLTQSSRRRAHSPFNAELRQQQKQLAGDWPRQVRTRDNKGHGSGRQSTQHADGRIQMQRPDQRTAQARFPFF